MLVRASAVPFPAGESLAPSATIPVCVVRTPQKRALRPFASDRIDGVLAQHILAGVEGEGGDVEGAVHGERFLEVAPNASEGCCGPGRFLSAVQDQQNALRQLDGLEETGLLRVDCYVASETMLPVRVSTYPVRCLEAKLSGGTMLEDTSVELPDRLAPPMRYEPLGDLGAAAEQLHEGAQVLLGGGHDQPCVHVVKVRPFDRDGLA
mmetsp:Transcript_20542/g.51826  ORF Transcript_20542/g.51826 Transcript_20542/m.51826 type:complete len:207 (-) Transcript_20542:236-856(-)